MNQYRRCITSDCPLTPVCKRYYDPASPETPPPAVHVYTPRLVTGDSERKPAESTLGGVVCTGFTPVLTLRDWPRAW